MSVRFYNAGDKIDNVLSYSLPEGSDIHTIARWPFIAEREAWVEVPTELTIGGQDISVPFHKDIQRNYGHRGVVKLDAKARVEPINSEESLDKQAVGRSEEECLARGAEIWQLYLRKVVESHIADCQAAMSAGGAPKTAVGFTKRALKLLGVVDPGEEYFLRLSKGEKPGALDSGVAQLVAQMQTQQQQMMAILLGFVTGKLTPDEIKAALGGTAAPAAEPATTKPVTSGIVTGKTKPDKGPRETGLEVYDRKVKGKKDRASEAAKELESA